MVQSAGTYPKEDLLLVPVVNLMDVSEDDLVFSSHVIRNSFLFHPAHVALRKAHQTHWPNTENTIEKTTTTTTKTFR